MELYAISIDGQERLKLTNGEQLVTWAHAFAPSRWSSLFRNSEALDELSQATFEAFGWHVTLDVTSQGGHVQPRLSRTKAPEHLRQSLSKDAFDFFAHTIDFARFSDGVRAWCGILAELLGGDHRLIFIDEPDAFLHPPLARRLGEQVARLATRRAATVFVATHSSDFIFGAVSVSAEVTIVRLTYDGTKATASLLDPLKLSDLMRDALLRSTGILDALFHRAVVVCEGHSDRVFYDEINTRLLRAGRGIGDCLFVNAGNWQEEHKLVAPLRQLGIPVAAIVDFDAMHEDDFRSLMAAATTSDSVLTDMTNLIASIRAPLKEAKELSKQTKRPAIDHLDAEVQGAARRIAQLLAEHGVFVVLGGSVESWLPNVAGRVRKKRWVRRILQKLGTDPTDSHYIQPCHDDVWAFIDGIGVWLTAAEFGG
jgi:hypothetical protein